MSNINFNGEITLDDQLLLNDFIRGFKYGDGVFEGLRSYSGRVFRLNAHLDRLVTREMVGLGDEPLGAARGEMWGDCTSRQTTQSAGPSCSLVVRSAAPTSLRRPALAAVALPLWLSLIHI